MRRFLILVALLTITGSHAADVPTVLIFGDSLSAGYGIEADQSWATLLQSRLREQGYEHRVVNASISGETTEGGAERIGPALDNFSPELIILELGGNDGLRGFPPARMRQNLEKIITTSKASGAGVVLLGIRIPSNYGSLDIPWIEFFMDGIALNEELMQADGIHPNANAQPILLDNAWPIIREALGPAK
jgi:acyl-CoA thioesterase-1